MDTADDFAMVEDLCCHDFVLTIDDDASIDGLANLVRGLWACVWRRLQVEGVACNLSMKWREELGGKGNTWRESHVEARS